MSTIAGMSETEALNKIWYALFGNGIKGAIDRIEDTENAVVKINESINKIELHHAGEAMVIEQAIENAFEKRFGKKNNSVLLWITGISTFGTIGALIVMIIALSIGGN